MKQANKLYPSKLKLRPQFSLRALLVLMGIAAIVIWQYERWWTHPEWQLRRRGVEVYYHGQYDYSESGDITYRLGVAARKEPEERVGAVFWKPRGTLTVRDIEILGELPHLEVLELSNTSIPDACAEPLARLPALRCLTLYRTNISDAAFLKLASLKTLTVIDVFGSTVSYAATVAFKNRRPDVNVVRWDH